MDPLSLVVGFVVGLSVGVLVGLFVASRRQSREAERFQALAGEALAQNNERFVERLGPLDARLKELREATERLERDRKQDEGQLLGHVKGLREAASTLQGQTTALESALRGSSQAGGRWGEMALRNVVELAGLTEHCDFEEQPVLDGGGRPDLLVRLPGGGAVAIDAKAPVRDYLTACESADEATRNAALDRHATALRRHVDTLAKRDYGASREEALDLVVLFVPSEAVLAAAFRQLPGLLEEGLRKRVLIASPTSLVALLRTIALYWQQRGVADNAREIAEAARELYKRLGTFAEHLDKIGKGLHGATESYHKAVGSFERRLLPQGRRLEDLKVPAPGEEIDAPRRVEEG